MHLLLYSRGGNLSTTFQLLSRVPDEEWKEARQKALVYVQEQKSFYFLPPEHILQNDVFQLWRGLNTFDSEIRMLYAKVKLNVYSEFEIQDKNPVYKITYMHVADALERSGLKVEFIVVSLDPSDEISCVTTPNLSVRSAALNRVLDDAEKLIETNGALSGLDRAHTMFHGYLQLVCEEAGIAFDAEVPVTTLFQLLREKHPKLQVSEPELARQMTDVHRGMARIIDALGPLRNRSSLAHANKLLLAEPEAMLTVNCIRTLLHYLNSKLRAG